jgi:hypothetical protein
MDTYNILEYTTTPTYQDPLSPPAMPLFPYLPQSLSTNGGGQTERNLHPRRACGRNRGEPVAGTKERRPRGRNGDDPVAATEAAPGVSTTSLRSSDSSFAPPSLAQRLGLLDKGYRTKTKRRQSPCSCADRFANYFLDLGNV